MKGFKTLFEIAEDINCPLYDKGEIMELSEKTFSCPEGKEVCLILVRDMTQLLFAFLKEQGEGNHHVNTGRLLSCSGCTGLIKFRELSDTEDREVGPETVTARINSVMQELHGKVIDSPFLRALPMEQLHTVLNKFQEVRVPNKTVLIHQGEPNPNLYIIMSGAFEVENNGEVISTLYEGEIFGEMSYLGAKEAVATVRATSDAQVLGITAKDFGELLDKVTSVQVYMAKLLAERLQQVNEARARDFESGMRGRLDDVVPAELFQVFHMHQKTGVLAMNLSRGEARVSFREGCIINARYGLLENEAAIFAMLAEKRGVYRFTTGLSAQEMKAAEIGDFMALLMEGVKRVDEDIPE